jgi:indolepyruvate ferredoxin oxidoreductase, alpha subunit
MERLSDVLLREEPWSGLMMGNHALVRAMLEARVRVVTTYPGSPTPEIASAIDAIPKEKRTFYFEYSVNEKVASEVAFGASLNGHLSTVFFKSVGLNVASDSVVQMGLLETLGGIVIVLGDDPGLNSSQNEQDNRHFPRMSFIPMFEPASPAQTYQMFLEAAALARRMHMAVFLRMTTHVCHARQVVDFGPLPGGDTYAWEPRFSVENGGPFIPVTSLVVPMKRRALAKLAAVETYATSSPSTIRHAAGGSPAPSGRRLGVIAASLPVLAVLEVLHEEGVAVDVLQLGITFPWPRGTVREFLEQHDEVLVIEELDRLLEHEIKSLAWDEGLEQCRILARSDEDRSGELGPAAVRRILGMVWPEAFAPVGDETGEGPAPGRVAAASEVVERPATMCPGCGHRAAFHAIKAALPPGTITVADIGCHTMGAYEPHNMGEVLLCMGHSNGTGAGLSLGNEKRKVVTFIGDSTFFHAGIPAITNAVWHSHPITLVVMENGTTAMTGHQPHAGSGEIGAKIPIRGVLESLGVGFIREVGAYQREKLEQTMKEAMDYPGFSVVIARHPCMLKFTRDRLRKGQRISKNARVDPVACAKIHECVAEFSCPSFIRHDDGSVTVNPDLCIGDGSCQPDCPVHAISLVDLAVPREA